MGERLAAGGNEWFAEVAKAWGASPEELEQLRAETPADEDVEDLAITIEPENADAVRLFLRLRTQWRTVARIVPLKGGGQYATVVRTGLDLSALPAIAQWLAIAPCEETLDGLGILEAESLRIYDARTEDALRRLR